MILSNRWGYILCIRFTKLFIYVSLDEEFKYKRELQGFEMLGNLFLLKIYAKKKILKK